MGKKILFTALALMLIAVLLIVILYWRTTIVSDLIRNVINDNFSQVAHIDYSSLKGNLFQTIFITDLQVELNNGTFIYSNSLKIRYNLFSTLSGKYDFKSITLDSLRIRLPAQVDTVVVDNSKTGQTYEEIITNFASSADLDSVLKKLPEINILR